jgi:hypothetical protein
VRLDVHVVSDLRRPLEGVRVVAELAGERTGWEGDVPADACVRVGAIRATLPAAPGPVCLSLSLTADNGAVTARNTYRTEVVE